MRKKFKTLALAGCAMLAVAGSAAFAQVADPDAALFGVRESAVGLDLSPSGNLVSYVAPSPGGGSVAFIADVQSGDTKPFLNSGGGQEHLRWCRFVTDQRLICRYTGIVNDAGVLLGFSRLIAINSDGSGIKQLGQESSFYDAGLRQYDGDIIDWLPGANGSVLMARAYVPESGKTGTRMIRSKNGFGVDRVDTLTLKVSPVEPALIDAGEFMSDGLGHVRLMGRTGVTAGETQLTGKTKYYYRTTDSKDWKPLTDFIDEDHFVPLAVDATTNSLYALKPLNGRKALYRIKLTDTLSTELIASHPRVDIDDVIRSANGQKVIGYTFAVDKRAGEYFDPEYKELVTALGRALPKLPVIDVERTSADGSKVLVYAGSDDDPGRFFVYDKKAKNLAEILLVRPELENHKLAHVQPVSVKAPDGVAIPAYLTLPPGKEAKNLPAVILPHGGPSSRDEWGFDWLAQFLAARGYAVIQPNYRGSAGYGQDWLNENGFRGWRTSIGDVTASAKYLVSQGIADPNRLAILGWSYGGYAALQSVATEPSLYKAAIAIAPVTDLDQLRNDASGYTNERIVKDFVGTGAHLTEGSPLRNVSAIRVPVLLAHGDQDANVAISHSERMNAALKGSGKPVEFLRFAGLDHQLDDSNARVQLLTRVGTMLDQRIGK